MQTQGPTLPDSRLHAMRALLDKDAQQRAPQPTTWQRVRAWLRQSRRQLWPTQG